MEDSAVATDNEVKESEWRDEVLPRLASDEIYQRLVEICPPPAGNRVLADVDGAVYYAYHRTKLVVRHMQEYTLHDGEHLFRVLQLMRKILPDETFRGLSAPELMLLILTAFFHDIGMAPSEDVVKELLTYWDESNEEVVRSEEFECFRIFVESKPTRLTAIRVLLEAGKYSGARLLQEYLLADYIRSTHAERARAIIKDEWQGQVTYEDQPLTTDFAELCVSHDCDPLQLLGMDHYSPCSDTHVCLPFLGVLLRLADILDFDGKRTPEVLFSSLAIRHPDSLREWNKHRQLRSKTILPNRIEYRADCSHPAIEAAIQEFCDDIDRELANCVSLLRHLHSPNHDQLSRKYALSLPPCVERSRVSPERSVDGKLAYRSGRRIQFHLDQRRIIDLLMGTRLYGDPGVALRELLQNSIDACRTRAALERSWGRQFQPEITIELTRGNNGVLRVVDNGTGMDEERVDNYYASLGTSYYDSGEFFSLQSEHGLKFQPISQFGIGILSCFMVADSIRVDTWLLRNQYDAADPITVLVERIENIFWITDGTRQAPGTTTELSLREGHPWSTLSDKDFIRRVQELCPNPPFPLRIIAGEADEEHTGVMHQSVESEWPAKRHYRQLQCDLNDSQLGLEGVADVALLISRGQPTTEKILLEDSVLVGGAEVPLKRQYHMRFNDIMEYSDSLEATDGRIEPQSYYIIPYRSHGQLSVRGIAVPMDLFPSSSWRGVPEAQLAFPFLTRLRVDVTEGRRLDLDTSRSRVLLNTKWLDFVEALSYRLSFEIRRQVEDDFWARLITLWNDTTAPEHIPPATIEAFWRGVNRV